MNFKGWSVFAFVLCAAAQARPSFEIQSIKGKEKDSYSASTSFKWGWAKREENVRAVVQLLVLKNSEFKQYKKALKKGKGSRVKLKGDSLTLQFNALSETVELRNGKKKLRLHIKGKDYDDEGSVVDENCKEFNLMLRALNDAPFYVGTSCVRTSRNLSITLSYPREVSLDDSTLRETKGKGEQWKVYELGGAEQAAEKLATFNFRYGGKKYDFELVPFKAKLADAPAPTSIFYAGIGYGFFSAKGPELPFNVANSANPILLFKVPHYRVWQSLGVSLFGEFNLPVGDSATPHRYYQLGMFASYSLPVARGFEIQPHLGYVISSQQETTTAIFVRSNHIGVGLRAILGLGKVWQLEFEGLLASLGSSVLNSHYSLELRVMRNKTTSIGYGLGAKLQNFNGTSPANHTRDFTQMEFFGLISF